MGRYHDDSEKVDWGTVLRNNSDIHCVPMSEIDQFLRITTNEKWFAGRMTRNLAEICVQRNNLPRGTFLIRERLTDKNGKHFALTVNDVGSKNGGNVKHYTIEQDDVTGAFMISLKPYGFKFESLSHLVQYYSKYSDLLCCLLTCPAFQTPSTPRTLIEKMDDGVDFAHLNTTHQNGSKIDVQLAVKTAIEAVHTQIRTTVSCSICQQVSKEPTLCMSCGQLVGCYTCVLTAVEHDERCPLCRHTWNRVNLTGFIKSRLSFDNISGL